MKPWSMCVRLKLMHALKCSTFCSHKELHFRLNFILLYFMSLESTEYIMHHNRKKFEIVYIRSFK